MPFKKLHSHIQEKLALHDITAATPFQIASIPVIKSGANCYGFAPENSGKTTTIIVTTLQKLKCEEVGNAPRAIVLVETREKATELYEAFLKYTRHSTLRVYLCEDKEHVDLLKSEIFEGVDILISITKTMSKLLLLNGVNTTQLKLLSIDDAAFLSNTAAFKDLMSITQSLPKCQYVMYAEKKHPILKRFESYFMVHPRTVSI